MPELYSRIVAPGFVPVPAVVGGEGVDRHDQAGPAARDPQPPGAVPARRAVPAGRGEGEPVPARRRAGPGAVGAALGFGPGAAVADGVSLPVGHRHAPGRPRVPRGGGHEVAGQPRVDRAQPGQLARPVGQAGRGAERDGQGDPAGEPAPSAAGRTRTRRLPRRAAILPGGVRGPGRAGPGVRAEDQVEEGAGAQLVHAAVQPGLLQLAGPPADPLIGGQHLIRGEFAAHQRGVAGVLGPPLHPREPGRRLTPLPGLAWRGLHHRPGHRGPQAAGGQPPGPVQDLGLHGLSFLAVEVMGEPDDQLGLAPGDDPAGQRVQRPAQPGGQVPRHRQQPVRGGPGLAQRQGQLIPGELVHHAGHLPRLRLEPVLGVTPEHLRDGHELAGRRVRLDPIPRAHQPGQLLIGHPAERVARPAAVRRGVGGHRQPRAARHGIPCHPGAEPGRPAGRLAREDPGRAGLPGPRRPVLAASRPSISSAAAARTPASSCPVSSS